MLTQVPRAPSSCCVVFGPQLVAVPEENTASGWRVHGEEASHAALQVMPEWAEVTHASAQPLQLQ